MIFQDSLTCLYFYFRLQLRNLTVVVFTFGFHQKWKGHLAENEKEGQYTY